ncbi:MAG: hypothetical protein ACI9KN_000134 [Gammaproteobacteria bacterium]|jgi:hypothetical protein
MKYIALIYELAGALDDIPQVELENLFEQHSKVQAVAEQRDAYMTAVELKPPQTDKSIRISNIHSDDYSDGTPSSNSMVSDGPFSDACEWFVGYYLFDCQSLNEALELAYMIPTTAGGGIELRPLDQSLSHGPNKPSVEVPLSKNKSMYALLNYHPEALIENYVDEVMEEMIASNIFLSEIATGNGDYIDGYRLMPSATATSLKGSNGHREIIDGPFNESKEVLLGLHILACYSQAVAIDYAKSLNDATHGIVEIRPIKYHDSQAYPDLQWSSRY